MNTSKFKFITDLPRQRQEIAAPVARSDTVRTFCTSLKAACGNGRRQRPNARYRDRKTNENTRRNYEDHAF